MMYTCTIHTHKEPISFAHGKYAQHLIASRLFFIIIYTNTRRIRVYIIDIWTSSSSSMYTA